MDSAVLIPVVAIVGGIVLVVMLIWHQMRMREMAMRERIALIERGLVPSPETDPARFEALMGRTSQPSPYTQKLLERASRYRTGGILMIGLGVALMMIIAFAANSPATAFGLGGAFVALGVAQIVNSLFIAPRGGEASLAVPPPPPPARDTQPGAGAP